MYSMISIFNERCKICYWIMNYEYSKLATVTETMTMMTPYCVIGWERVI